MEIYFKNNEYNKIFFNTLENGSLFFWDDDIDGNLTHGDISVLNMKVTDDTGNIYNVNMSTGELVTIDTEIYNKHIVIPVNGTLGISIGIN